MSQRINKPASSGTGSTGIQLHLCTTASASFTISSEFHYFTEWIKWPKLTLEAKGGEAKWELFYMAFRQSRSQTCQIRGDEEILVEVKLVQVSGLNCLVSKGFKLVIPEVDEGKGFSVFLHLADNMSRTFSVRRGKASESYSAFLNFHITIQFELCYKSGILGRLLEAGDQSDVTVQCGQLQIRAHRTILSAQSATFRTVFSSDSFSEGRIGIYTIKKENMDPAIVKDVLRWMYQQPVEKMGEKAVSLLAAAEYFQIATLKDTCVHLLLDRLNLSNSLELLNTAYLYSVEELQRRAVYLLMERQRASPFLSGDTWARADAVDTSSIPQVVKALLRIED